MRSIFHAKYAAFSSPPHPSALASSLSCRAELGLSDDYYQTSAGQRDRLLSTTDRLGKTSERIQHGRQQLLETEVR